jgi:VWFA-related protein
MTGANWGEAPPATPDGGKERMRHPTRRPLGRSLLLLLAAALLLPAASAAAADPKPPRIEILEPAEGRPVAGPLQLIARPERGSAALERVVFRVDGRMVGFRTEPPWQIPWDAGLEYAPFLLEVSAIDVNGLTATATREVPPIFVREHVTVLDSPMQEIHLSVTVTDRHGQPVVGLRQEDFSVMENGRPQVLSDFGREGDRTDRPLSVLLIVDRSASMRLHLKALDTTVARLLAALRPGDEVAVAAMMQGDFVELQPFVKQGKRLEDDLAEVTYASGSTPLFYAIEQGLNRMRDRTGRRVILALTDGWDDQLRLGVNFYQNNYLLDLARRAQRSDTQITLIWPGPPAQGHLAIESLVDETGGLIYYTREDMAALLERIAQDLQEQYYLGYYSDDPSRSGRRRRVTVDVNRPDMRVQTIGGFFSLSSQVHLFRQDLKNKDDDLRARAVRALVQVQSADASKLLRNAIKDESDKVRAEAAKGFGLRQDPEGIRVLVRTLDDPSPRVRAAAFDALVSFGQPATPALLEKLLRTDVMTRVLVLQLLGEIGDDRALQPVNERLASTRVEERAAAATALGALGLSGGIPGLRQALDDADKRVRLRAIHALSFIGGREAVAILEQYVGREPDVELRRQAAAALQDVFRTIRRE